MNRVHLPRWSVSYAGCPRMCRGYTSVRDCTSLWKGSMYFISSQLTLRLVLVASPVHMIPEGSMFDVSTTFEMHDARSFEGRRREGETSANRVTSVMSWALIWTTSHNSGIFVLAVGYLADEGNVYLTGKASMVGRFKVLCGP